MIMGPSKMFLRGAILSIPFAVAAIAFAAIIAGPPIVATVVTLYALEALGAPMLVAGVLTFMVTMGATFGWLSVMFESRWGPL